MRGEQNTGCAPNDFYVMDAIGRVIPKQLNHVRYHDAVFLCDQEVKFYSTNSHVFAQTKRR
jgi:hypothetical protein